MLKITVHQDSASWRLQLAGRLESDWVGETEKSWRSALVAGRRVEIDIREVTWVDEAGRRLLRSMHEAGTQFIAEGVAMTALIEEIIGKAPDVRHRGKHLHRLGYLLLAGITLHGLSVQAAEGGLAPVRLSLKEAVVIALRQNPQVAIANLNLAQSVESRKVARAGLLPQASFTASQNVTRGNLEALIGQSFPGLPQHFGPFWTTQAGPSASAPLFDLTLWHRWRAAKENVNTSTAQKTTAREMNVQLVISQYLGGLRAAADVSAAKSRLDLAKALFDLATDQQKNGVGTSIDTLRANVQYQNERQRHSEAETQLKVSLYGLSRLLNMDPQQPIELADESSFFETPPINSDQSLARAYQERPEMKTVLSQMRATEFQKRATEDQRLPRLSVGGYWNLQGLTPATMIPVYQFGASLEFPLFTGGRIGAETAINDIELKKLAQTRDDLRNQIAQEVKTAIAQLESARVEVEAANLGVTLAKEEVTQAQDRFRAGVANNIEIVTAQDELSRANDNQIRALYRYNQGRADLARATGQIEALYSH